MNQFTKCNRTETFGFSKARYDEDELTVTVNGQNICRINAFDLQGMNVTERENGRLIAATFTAGTLVDHEGYNMVKVLDNLPRILSLLDLLNDNTDVKHYFADLLKDLQS